MTKSSSRRTFLRTSVIGGALSYSALAKAEYLPKLIPTPHEVEGPFYPVTPQKDKDFDLTQYEGSSGVAKGDIIWIEGAVVSTNGLPVEDASVEIWQANAAGRYRHPHDTSKAPLDPNFQGWAIVASGKEGKFKFKTVMPGSYPAGDSWIRPPHIHFKVSKRGYVELVTQLYFPNHPLNAQDFLFKRKGAEEQRLMVATEVSADPQSYRYQIILQPA